MTQQDINNKDWQIITWHFEFFYTRNYYYCCKWFIFIQSFFQWNLASKDVFLTHTKSLWRFDLENNKIHWLYNVLNEWMINKTMRKTGQMCCTFFQQKKKNNYSLSHYYYFKRFSMCVCVCVFKMQQLISTIDTFVSDWFTSSNQSINPSFIHWFIHSQEKTKKLVSICYPLSIWLTKYDWITKSSIDPTVKIKCMYRWFDGYLFTDS